MQLVRNREGVVQDINFSFTDILACNPDIVPPEYRAGYQMIQDIYFAQFYLARRGGDRYENSGCR